LGSYPLKNSLSGRNPSFEVSDILSIEKFMIDWEYWVLHDKALF
jgi:hypothetical protein